MTAEGAFRLELDHLAVLGTDLAAAEAHVRAKLGRAMGPGGQHAHFGTHNRLLGLAPALYLEAISCDPAAAALPYARWFGLDAFGGPPRLDKWILRTDDLEAALAQWPMAGRRVELSRGDLRWAMAVPEDGMLPFDGLFPALIQWHSDAPPGRTLPGSGWRLERLVVSHPRAHELEALLEPFLVAPAARLEAPAARLEAPAARLDGGTPELIFAPADRPALAARLVSDSGEVWL